MNCIIRITVVLLLPLSVLGQVKGTLWDVPGIDRTPAYEIISRDSALGIVYEGLPYRGGLQRVFAYYATPGTLSGNASRDHHLPAVVLVHGGGGSAFREWAIRWALKGYAAIAMDLRGNGPGKTHLEQGFIEPGNKTPYFTITPALEDQWMFQAVANVILAHNLVRHMPGVDSNRTAITGISWGGIITSLMAGLDKRYKAAVPVYGCGFLFESSNMKKDLDSLSSTDRSTWIDQYDPSRYAARARMPMLFVNGTNDGHFYLDSYAKTYNLVKNKQLCIKPGLRHNHRFGWSNDETDAFINSILNHTPPLAGIRAVKTNRRQAAAKVRSVARITTAFLHFTTDTNASLKDRVWQSQPARLEGQKGQQKIVSPLPPPGTSLWFLSVTDERGLHTSSEVMFGRPGKNRPGANP